VPRGAKLTINLRDLAVVDRARPQSSARPRRMGGNTTARAAGLAAGTAQGPLAGCEGARIPSPPMRSYRHLLVAAVLIGLGMVPRTGAAQGTGTSAGLPASATVRRWRAAWVFAQRFLGHDGLPAASPTASPPPDAPPRRSPGSATSRNRGFFL